jgi:hypothetical protein
MYEKTLSCIEGEFEDTTITYRYSSHNPEIIFSSNGAGDSEI